MELKSDYYIEINKDDKAFQRESLLKNSDNVINSDSENQHFEAYIDKIITMVNQTKYLLEDTEINSVKGKEKTKRQLELLDTFSNIEKGLHEYVDGIKTIQQYKLDDLKISISEKLLENYLIISDSNLDFIKGLEQRILIEYNLFSNKLDTIDRLEQYFGFDLNYSKFEPETNNSSKLVEQLRVMEDDLFLSFIMRIEEKLEVNILPKFLTNEVRLMIREKLMSTWQKQYEIPMKKLKLDNSYEYKLLSSKFLDLVNDKFNLFDYDLFSSDDRLLYFEVLFYSNVANILKSDYSKQCFLNNLKKYIFLLGIYDNFEKICLMVDKFITVNPTDSIEESYIKNELTVKANDILNDRLIKLSESFFVNETFLLDKFLLLVLSFSLMLNNLMAYSITEETHMTKRTIQKQGDLNIMITFTGDLKCSARERQFLLTLILDLENITNKPNELNVLQINRLCENYVFEPLIKSFSKTLFDENNINKIDFCKETILNKPFENKDLTYMKEGYSKIFNEIKFTTEPKKYINKIKKKVGSVFSFVGEKLGIKKDNKTEIDISHLRLYPYDYVFTSTHICLCIGGALVGPKFNENTWKKLYLRENNIDYYFFDWISDFIPALGFYLLDLIQNDEHLYEKKSFKKELDDNDLLFLKEKSISAHNSYISKILGKILAYIIASKCFFSFHSISLLGYSLGANVIKYCLKELHKISQYDTEAYEIIQNVIFISGATSFTEVEDEDTEWASIFNLVSGKIVNVYSQSDTILDTAYTKFIEEKPIGVKRLIIKDKQEKDMIHNYDCTKLKLSHFEFPLYLDKILNKINVL